FELTEGSAGVAPAAATLRPAPAPPPAPTPPPAAAPPARLVPLKAVGTAAQTAAAVAPVASAVAPMRRGRVMTSPANRRRAREAGIDLASVAGSGPGGRILRADLESSALREAV